MILKAGRWEGSIEGCITFVGYTDWEWGFTNWLVRRGWYRRNEVFEYKAHPTAPLTYIRPDGTRKRPDNHFLYDLGSVPPIFDWMVGRTDFIKSFTGHDSDYEHQGAWFWEPAKMTWTFKTMSREDADRDLAEGALGEGGARAKVIAVWTVVSRFGGPVWADREVTSVDKERKQGDGRHGDKDKEDVPGVDG